MKEESSLEGYIRVTSVLYPFSGMDKINPEILQNAANRGTRVHNICEAIMQGFGEFDIDEVTAPYVESFKKWWELGHDIHSIETRFFDEDLKITGQADLILNSENGLTIIDLKTSYQPSKTWKAQGCAYAYLAKKSGLNIQKIQFLHLLKSGKAAKVYEYDVDDEFFLKIYDVWKYFYNKP